MKALNVLSKRVEAGPSQSMHSFSSYVLNTTQVPDAILDTGDTVVPPNSENSLPSRNLHSSGNSDPPKKKIQISIV